MRTWEHGGNLLDLVRQQPDGRLTRHGQEGRAVTVQQHVTARPLPRADLPPLLGWTVAVTGARRGIDVVALLEQRGARVVHVPAVRILPLEDDGTLRTATVECLARPFSVVVATTGVGFSTWLEAADGWGLGEQLRQALASAQVLARGPKASGAVHSSGLRDAARPPCESTWDILERLLASDLAGRRVVVQLHGADLDDFTRSLRIAGADVLEVPVYRTAPPDDEVALLRLVEQVLRREVQAVTFTSAAAVTHLLDAASATGSLDAVLDAFSEVLPVCVGEVAAAPLERLSVATIRPEQARIGALVHALTSTLQQRAVRVHAAGHDLEVRGDGAVVDGSYRALAPAPMAALRAMARHPGRVLSQADLRRELPGDGDERAVAMAISRLRAGLGDPRCVPNVVKRGYRLACAALEPAPEAPEETTPAADPPLLQSVGGTPGIRETVERLYSRLLEDPQVSHHFAGVDMPRLKRHQVLLLSQMLGGPAQYSGRELADAHADLAIAAEDYVCVIEHLVAVLRELAVDEHTVQSMRSCLEAVAHHVVADG
jgi:uroporphyrinogen-III synthase